MDVEMDFTTVCSNVTGQEAGGACDHGTMGISMSTPILMMSAGVLGNLLALIVLFTADKQVRQVPFFPLLMGTVCIDFVGQFTAGTIAVLVYANNLQWVGGRALCLFHGFAMVFFAVITPLLVSSMSLERLLALRFSYFYHRCFSTRVAKCILLAALIFTLFFCTWPFLGLGRYTLQYPGSWCFLDYHNAQSLSSTVYALIFSCLNITTIVFIVACNVTVVFTLLKMRRTRSRMCGSPSMSSGRQVTRRVRNVAKLEMETQMVWLLSAVTVVFCCLWLPLNIRVLITQFTETRDMKQGLITVRLASINQIIHPWMYVILRKNTVIIILRRLRQLLTPGNTARTPSARQP